MSYSNLAIDGAADGSATEQTGTQGVVLVVDDVPDNRAVLVRRFERRGYDVKEAESGIQALEMIAKEKFDVIMLDVMMPEMDGLETLKRIRSDHTAGELPVIMVTARNQSEDVSEALQMGANDYVTKPVDFVVALARVTSQVGRKRAEDETRKALAALKQLNEELEEKVRERTAGLREVNHRLTLEISQRERSEEQARYLAHHDELTGLPNRRLFQEQIDLAISEAKRTGETVSLAFFDVDRFKNVNDSMGHSMGDALLLFLGHRLRETAGMTAKVARLGGDEFAFILPAAEPDMAKAIVDRAVSAIGEPFHVGEQKIEVGISAGLAMSPAGKTGSETLIQQADQAMYRAKSKGRGTFCVFDEQDVTPPVL